MIQGLDKLKKLIRTLKDVKKEAAIVADISVAVNANELVELNKKQLSTGRDGNDEALEYKKKRKGKLNPSNAYTAAYDRYKSKRGKQTNYVDLNLTGQYLKTLKLDHVRKGVFRINSTGEALLQRELEWNYGKDIHGISEDNLKKFAKEHIEPDINERVQQLLDRI